MIFAVIQAQTISILIKLNNKITRLRHVVSITHIITSLESGGAQNILLEFIKHSQKNARIENTVISITNRKSFLKDEIEKYNVQVYYLSSIQDFTGILKTIKKTTVFKAWMYHSCIISTIIKILHPNKKVIWSIHHGKLSKNDSLSVKITARATAFLSKYIPKTIIYPSITAKNNHIFLGFAKNKSSVIYNPINIKKQTPNNRQEKKVNTIGFIGRNHPTKNLELFVHAALVLLKKRRDIIFVICGFNTKKDSLISKINTEGFSENFLFLGELKDTSSFYNQIKIYTSLSSVESFGLTLIEAYINKCVLVCTPLPVYHELLGDEIIFTYDWSINAILEAWNKALAIDDNVNIKHEKIIRFDTENIIQQYIDTINA